ncbi:dihydroxy-acid dehydratase [Mesorhizobium sp. M4B.F.Ca.ET.215.01.1.1]|uniref:IlvD/Edd family dehydratase n=3 Tax=Mesorhizobium TaxID=68287 RepID=UPI000FCB26BB|nr:MULTISPECIES: IlvD/Edd family dehydratase [unclassified Mesorhizobium]RVD40359.1 dihydroxy-acid dehydratase [Mesorhizobium sp. M4B.F.Ca.ET.019.03.1.1]TGQ04275.1 dihydroxy-acid dehydratase [Mesorhizobium sp. M4B.F.Ca.ET.215.01.1.1]TGQ25606.1 dihydroxy-acid dehydratase [Mesorhizobium sp. M00.F.Ca.ET.220.01.1.1]TGQ28443.1 dihydroxy-acid dehydratase [Mesorhizobium sp. M4B.F.Ca.ET.214.01.1.1]TGQ55420.1 dihydroxy-acid dehydratase [Mesorhizobium sp. M4B.F.Ca.ET.211.01.1.1]
MTSYGDAAFSLFLRKAFIKAAGYSDDALERPIVGIVDTASDYNPCHGNAPQLIEAVKRGVMLSGALPMVFPTISIHESFAHPTSMVLRNLMAMDTEEMIRAQPMDAVVVIGGCDKTLPAQIMGAISADLPAVVVPVGSMVAGHHKGETLGACTDCRRLWSSHRAGDIDAAEIDLVNGRLAPSVGTCMVMGTASTMAIVAEVMGFSLSFAASIPAPHAERVRSAEASGRAAATLAVAGAPLPGAIVTPASIRNAMVVTQAIGGSTNGIIHLAAIAGRAGHPVDLAEFDRIGREVPVLVDLKPSGEHYMEHFHQAGGVPRLLAELVDVLDLTTPMVEGGTLGDRVMKPEDMHAQDVIRPLGRPVTGQGAMAVLSGNLCPRGAVIKHSAASPALMQHSGRAVVFESVADLAERIDDPALDVTADDVLVLRNAGPRGAPGMPEAGYIPIPKKLAALGVKDMVRLSDARMSGTAFGTVVLHVSPEAAAGGPLALLQNGDMIRLDVPARRIDMLVDDAELARRAAIARPAVERPARGYARLYHDHVLQADQGCDFDFLTASGAAGEGPE